MATDKDGSLGSPVERDQSTVPIADAVEAYLAQDRVAFSIPAHSGGRTITPEFTRWAGPGAARYDLPMGHGVDTRNRAWEVQETAQELFAEAVGARRTLFSTNGSSLSARAAIMTVAGPGETIVMARNGHKSAIAGLVLSGARPAWVDPVFDDDLEVALGPTADDVEATLDAHPDARAVMIFTPSYYGTSADVAAIAAVCHARGVPLVTDDAWGLDYALSGHPDLPEGALQQGSDLAIDSVHKTLTGLQQTSVFSVGSERIDEVRLQLCFELEESTSVSTLLLSSIDGARRQFVRDGERLLGDAVRSAKLLRRRLREEVPELPVVSVDRFRALPGVTGVDPTHVLIETEGIGLTGYAADDWLRDERQIDLELADHRRVMALVTFAHGGREVDRLVRALRDLVDMHGRETRGTGVGPWPSREGLRTEQVVTPRDAFFGRTALVDADEAVGMVSAELVTPYPPGIPVLAPGERVNEEIVRYLRGFVDAGGFVEGAADGTLKRLRVLVD